MSQLSRKEHITRQVIGTLIGAAILGAISFVPGVWSWVTSPVETVRVWYWFLFAFFVVAVLAWIGMWMQALGQPHRMYCEDRFFDMVWRWRWNAKGRSV